MRFLRNGLNVPSDNRIEPFLLNWGDGLIILLTMVIAFLRNND
jgi:hypothetical protein